MIKLANDTIARAEIDELISWLGTNPPLTMGEKTKEFEAAFADMLGVKHSVFVNSGSSANLLMVYALKEKYGINKMAVPALSWVTDVSPLIQLGIEPVLIDCNMEDLSLDIDHLEEVMREGGLDAVLSVSVLGFTPNMSRLLNLCNEYGVRLIEDNCESLGSLKGSKHLGTWGEMTSHSFYFGHQMSTIEGGMVSTNDTELYNLIKMLRSHGWARDVGAETRAALRDRWGVDDFQEMFTFYVPGFNLRSTEIQAFLGLGQIERLSSMVECRHENFKLYHETLDLANMWVPHHAWFDKVSNLAYPVVSHERDNIAKRLHENNIECRPIIAGSMGQQPFYKEKYGATFLPNADRIHKHGLYVPNTPDLTIPDIKKICRVLTSYYA